MKKHQKHPKLAKPHLGKYHRNEWAIVGTNCGAIKELAISMKQELMDYKVGYLDASHAKDLAEPDFSLGVLDCQKYHQLEVEGGFNEYDYKIGFNEMDVLLVNGNHFPAARQIVVLDEAKLGSLERRLEQLTDIQLILNKNVNEIPDFLKEKINGKEIPVVDFNNKNETINYIKNTSQPAPVYGLVLAGGRSTRMGADKGKIIYHGKAQREYLYDILKSNCEKTYLSCREDQVGELGAFPTIADNYPGLGVFGAILSAFRKNPNVAWLVVACDLPFVNNKIIKKILEKRSFKNIATAFYNSETGFADPLLTIYEPKSYLKLVQFMTLGYSCPRKVLINSDTHLIKDFDQKYLRNVNTKEEMEALKK